MDANGDAHKPLKKGQGAYSTNTLTDAKKFALWTWLRQQEAAFQRDRPARHEVAEAATAALGFPVTARNVSSAVDAGVIAWPEPKASAKRRWRQDVEDTLAQMNVRLAKLEADLANLKVGRGQARPGPGTTAGMALDAHDRIQGRPAAHPEDTIGRPAAGQTRA